MSDHQDNAFRAICREATSEVVADAHAMGFSDVVAVATGFHLGLHVGVHMGLMRSLDATRLLAYLDVIAGTANPGEALDPVARAIAREVLR